MSSWREFTSLTTLKELIPKMKLSLNTISFYILNCIILIYFIDELFVSIFYSISNIFPQSLYLRMQNINLNYNLFKFLFKFRTQWFLIPLRYKSTRTSQDRDRKSSEIYIYIYINCDWSVWVTKRPRDWSVMESRRQRQI